MSNRKLDWLTAQEFDHFVRHSDQKARLAAALVAVIPPRTRTILDVGCGNGMLLRLTLVGLRDLGLEPSVDLVDPRPRVVSVLRKLEPEVHGIRRQIGTRIESLRSLARYDVVTMIHSLYDVFEKVDGETGTRRALRNGRRALQVSGILVVGVVSAQRNQVSQFRRSILQGESLLDDIVLDRIARSEGHDVIENVTVPAEVIVPDSARAVAWFSRFALGSRYLLRCPNENDARKLLTKVQKPIGGKFRLRCDTHLFVLRPSCNRKAEEKRDRRLKA